MSLADELLADLDEIDNDDLEKKLESIKEEPIETEDAETEAEVTPMEIDVSVSKSIHFRSIQSVLPFFRISSRCHRSVNCASYTIRSRCDRSSRR